MEALPSVCVIGAGVSGLTAIKALSDFALPLRCFEASDDADQLHFLRRHLVERSCDRELARAR